MNSPYLKNRWLAEGARIKTLPMCEYIANVTDVETESKALRETVVLSDLSYTKKLRFDESDGADFLDEKLAANILKLRYGKSLETFLANENGKICATTTVVNIDDNLYVIAESIDDESFAILENDIAENLDSSHTLLSIDGPDAWKVAKDIFGADIFNLSFMAVEKYSYENQPAIVMRTGKTGEFGYQILVPNTIAPQLFEELKTKVLGYGGALAGVDTLLSARAKGNFFNIFAEGKCSQNPFELGLQWQIDMSKQDFAGAKAIFDEREKTPTKKLIAVVSENEIAQDAKIYTLDKLVGEIVNVDKADKKFALALIDFEIAYPNQSFATDANGEDCLKTVSRPAIVTQSLLRGMD